MEIRLAVTRPGGTLFNHVRHAQAVGEMTAGTNARDKTSFYAEIFRSIKSGKFKASKTRGSAFESGDLLSVCHQSMRRDSEKISRSTVCWRPGEDTGPYPRSIELATVLLMKAVGACAHDPRLHRHFSSEKRVPNPNDYTVISTIGLRDQPGWRIRSSAKSEASFL